ncbi:hypothetical protein [Ornithinibacillus contaminans]|uniref:hypothetical protein n=1 Tax=Ornithinibacillus contaminans TaxID=694055 RepID=UPI00069E3E68|nr:hypothetical protein [Ornithinibacillus contaminans]
MNRVGSFAIILVLMGIGLSYILPLSASENSANQQLEGDAHNKNTDSTITHDEIIRLTDRFMSTILQDIDDNYRVKNYDTKDELLEEFATFSTKEAAKDYVDYYFYEEIEGLYIVPTETPPWFDKQNDYDVVQLDYQKALVKQENDTAMYGKYTIELEFTLENQGWKLTKISHH